MSYELWDLNNGSGRNRLHYGETKFDFWKIHMALNTIVLLSRQHQTPAQSITDVTSAMRFYNSLMVYIVLQNAPQYIR